ncbi:MAG: alpha/beta fold hydrolase [Gemmatimonadota bacterium]
MPPFKPDRRLFPFASKWYESPVGRIHYVDEGEGAPILFLHGNPTWSFLYRGIIIRLRKRFRCVALDYPGFGLSAHPQDYGYTPAEHARVVSAFVRHLELENLTIMGHDWGGPIGMRVALDTFARLRALVMGNTWYWPADSWQQKTFSYVLGSAPLQTQLLRRNFFVDKILPLGVKYPLADEVMQHYREPFPTPDSRVGVAELPRQILASELWLGQLAGEVAEQLINVPLLLVWGLEDLAYPRQLMERFREDFRLTSVRRLDARHYIQEDQPGEIAEAIEEFLAGVPVPA